MTKRDITMDEIVEGMARARCCMNPEQWRRATDRHRVGWTRRELPVLRAVIRTANITEAQLIALARGEACVVPSELTEDQAEHMSAAGQICGGIAESVYRAALKARP